MRGEKDRLLLSADGSKAREYPPVDAPYFPNPTSATCATTSRRSSVPDPVPTWNGSRVFRLGGIRHLVNFWRLREFTDDGFRVVFYRSRAGVVILSVTVVVA